MELAQRISNAVEEMSNATLIMEEDDGKVVVNRCLNEISRVLLESDVQFKLVRDLQTNIKNIINHDYGHNKHELLQQAIFIELCKVLDPGKPSFAPKKGQTSVVMFVGLQGSGKTAMCTQYACYYQKMGWKPALVCADAFNVASDQLKQNATKANIPFYGSETESDKAVKIAIEGVERFKKESCDLIIVNTSGQHKQEMTIFEELCQVYKAVIPDLVICVLDSSIGQAAFDQVQDFKQHVSVGSVNATKMDKHAKGGGTLSVVATKESPVICVGTGEDMDEYEVFDVQRVISCVIGMPKLSGLMQKIYGVFPKCRFPERLQTLEEGKFTLRMLHEECQILSFMQKIDAVTKVWELITGYYEELKGREEVLLAKSKRYMAMLDSLTDEELDSWNPDLMNDMSRVMKVAWASGREVCEVVQMFQVYQKIVKKWSNWMKRVDSLKVELQQAIGWGMMTDNIQLLSTL